MTKEDQTLPERLDDLARKTEQRIGNHPEADLCREAAQRIRDLESQPVATPKATRARKAE